MPLSKHEQLIALISNGISVYSLYLEEGKIPQNTTLFDFVSKVVPPNLKSELTIELIDEVFDYVSSAHSSNM